MTTNSSADIPTGAANTVLQGGGVGSNSVFSTATYPATTTASQLLYSSATNTVGGLATANNGVLVTSNSGVPSVLTSTTAGQVLTANSSAAPSWQNPAGDIWVDQTSASVTLAKGTGYVIDNGASLVTLTLPATAALGDTYTIIGFSSGKWLVAQNASQLIHIGSSTTTTGAGGSLAATNAFDTVQITCVVTNTTFVVAYAVGNLTVV